MAISRQQYGLGSLVKSIGKGVKKFVKSPLGKAAILGIGAFGLPGGAFGMKGLLPQGMRSLSGIGSALFANPKGMANLHQDPGIFTKALSKFTNMGTGAKIGIGSGLLTWLMSEKGLTEDQATKLTQDPESLRGYLKLYHSQLNPDKSDEEVNEWVEVNMKADGGRVGLYAGSPREGIESIEIDENVQMASDPDRMDSINELSLELFGKDLHLLTEEELNQLNDEADRLMQKFSLGNQQENMKVAGGGDRGWRAQMLAEDLAQEQYGKEYYDLSHDQQMEIYNIALDMIDTGNMAKGGRVGLQGGGMDASQDDFKTPSTPPPGHPQYNIGAGGGGNPPITTGGNGGDPNEPNILEKITSNPAANVLASFLLPQSKMKKAWDMMNFVNTVGNVADSDLKYGLPYQKGGRVGLALGTEDTAQAAGILGNLPVRQNKAGVNELDLRETGGFIPPVGVKEKADDVPAMLSNNEFVFTADAVRAAGGGSVNKGAQVLYDKMKQLEGQVV